MPDPPPIRYVTTSGLPPNGGLVPSNFVDAEWASESSSPPSPPLSPLSDSWSHHAQASDTRNGVGMPASFNFDPALLSLLLLSSLSAGRALAPRPVPDWSTEYPLISPVASRSRHENPRRQHGRRRDSSDSFCFGNSHHERLLPRSYTVIHFWYGTQRPTGRLEPWDQSDPVKTFEVPCLMQVRELIEQLLDTSHRETGRRPWGIQEVFQSVSRQGRPFEVAKTFHMDGDFGYNGRQTLENLGWTERRGDNNPVLLVSRF